MAPYIDVVVLHEYKLVSELRVAHHFGDLLQQALAGIIMRMRFAGEYELHGALGIVDHGRESFDIRENQVGPLVGGKPACEPDRQRVGTQYAA